MTPVRVIVVSDTHLSPAAPEAGANWDAVLRHIDAAGADLTDHLWAPSTWAVLPDEVQPALGAKRCGIVSLEFAGGAPPQPKFAEPDGIAQLTLIRDLPDPYHR